MGVKAIMAMVAGLMLAGSLSAADPDVFKLLGSVEDRYNRLKTLQIYFNETYRPLGRPRIAEQGNLYLRKPGRMRWAYEQPAGKLFVSDGKFAYLYTPDANRVEKIALKEADDFRAPLAFLLGKLDFRRDFGRFQLEQKGPERWITCWPKNDRLPYKKVQFLITPDSQIKRLIVDGDDGSQTEFAFGAESLNLALSDSLFIFKAPPGVELIDSSKETPSEARK